MPASAGLEEKMKRNTKKEIRAKGAALLVELGHIQDDLDIDEYEELDDLVTEIQELLIQHVGLDI